MANVVVVGAQWGDEGKGKIVDWLSEQADIVVRFQGGHNAGHTLVIDGVTYKLSLLPSGVVRPGKLSVIGNGVVLDPHALIEEIGRLKQQGVAVTPDRLRIAENATLILPLHQQLDVALLRPVAQQAQTDVVGAGRQPDDGIRALWRRDRAALLPGLTVRHGDLCCGERRAARPGNAALQVDRVLCEQAGGAGHEPSGGQQHGAESMNRSRRHRTIPPV